MSGLGRAGEGGQGRACSGGLVAKRWNKPGLQGEVHAGWLAATSRLAVAVPSHPPWLRACPACFPARPPAHSLGDLSILCLSICPSVHLSIHPSFAPPACAAAALSILGIPARTSVPRYPQAWWSLCPLPLTPASGTASPARPQQTCSAAGNDIGVNDAVDVVDGPLKGRSGAVKYIMRGFLFIQTREVAENAGFICLQARHTKVGGQFPGPACGSPLGGVWRELAGEGRDREKQQADGLQGAAGGRCAAAGG